MSSIAVATNVRVRRAVVDDAPRLSRPPPPLARPEARSGGRRAASFGEDFPGASAPRLSRSRRKPGGFLSRESVVAARAERGSIRILLLLLRVREVSRGAAFSQRLGFLPRHRRGDDASKPSLPPPSTPRTPPPVLESRAGTSTGDPTRRRPWPTVYPSRALGVQGTPPPLVRASTRRVVILGSRSDVLGAALNSAIERVDGGVGAGIDGDVAKIDRCTDPPRRERVGRAKRPPVGVPSRVAVRSPPPAHVREEPRTRRARRTREQSRATAVPKPRAKAKTKAKTKRRARTPPSPPPRACRRETRATTRAMAAIRVLDSERETAVGFGHVAGLGRARGCESRIRERLRDVPPSEIRAPARGCQNQRAETPKPPEAYGSLGCVVRVRRSPPTRRRVRRLSRYPRSRSTTTSRSRRESSRVDILSDTCRTGMRWIPRAASGFARERGIRPTRRRTTPRRRAPRGASRRRRVGARRRRTRASVDGGRSSSNHLPFRQSRSEVRVRG